MTVQIKDVEQLTGMPRANIRYYEKQGLLKKMTRNEYNFREYTEEDVRQLQRIKFLRMFEVSINEIKEMKDDIPRMEEIITKLLSDLTDTVDEIIYKK